MTVKVNKKNPYCMRCSRHGKKSYHETNEHDEAVKKLNTRAPLDRSPKKNEVERRGGLPMYIRRIANHLHAEKGMTIGHAIATAKNAAQKMCASGDLNFRGKQNVNSGSRAEACAAIADWNARIKGSGVSKSLGITTQAQRDRAYIKHLIVTKSHGINKNFNPKQPRDPSTGEWIDTEGLKFAHNMANAMFYANEAKDPRPKRRKRPKVTTNPDGSVTVTVGKGEFTEQIRTNAKNTKNKKLLNFHRGMDPSDERIKASLGSKKKKKRVVRQKMSDKEFESLQKIFDPDDPDAVEFELRGEVSKVDADKQLVFGWASVSRLANGEVVVDKQGDVLDNLDDVERVAYDFVVESREGGEMHVRKGVSTLVESFVSTPEKREKMGIPEGVLPDGWWVGFKVTNSQVWENVKKGKYSMFSVHGTGMRKAMEDAD